ncbi:hypothetical protein V8C44DRAFT_117666 [Trichoderma aethiopicum]
MLPVKVQLFTDSALCRASCIHLPILFDYILPALCDVARGLAPASSSLGLSSISCHLNYTICIKLGQQLPEIKASDGGLKRLNDATTSRLIPSYCCKCLWPIVLIAGVPTVLGHTWLQACLGPSTESVRKEDSSPKSVYSSLLDRQYLSLSVAARLLRWRNDHSCGFTRVRQLRSRNTSSLLTARRRERSIIMLTDADKTIQERPSHTPSSEACRKKQT